MRKISLESWLLFTRDYFADLKGKDIYSEEVIQEVNKRIKQITSLERMLYKSGQLEEPPDDFNESYRQLCEANKKLGWKVNESEKTKQRVKSFSEGKAGFIIYEEGQEKEAIKAAMKLAKRRGLEIKKIEKVE